MFVWVAKVDQIDLLFRNRGDEIVLSIAGHVNQPFVSAVFISWAGVAEHYVGVDVNRVNRIGDRDFVPRAEDVQDVARIAL